MGVKISELNEATSVQNSDVLPIVQNGETKKVPVETLGSQKVNKTGDTMTGNLDMQSNSVKFGTDGNIQWKEDNFGDKFRIISNFTGTGSDNKLIFQSTTGGAGEDPQNWKDLLNIHADTGRLTLPDGGFVPKFFHLAWGTSFTVTTNWGGHGLIMVSNDALYMFWIAGANHNEIWTSLISGSDVCNISMPDSNHINVSRKDGQNMTCDVLFLTDY